MLQQYSQILLMLVWQVPLVGFALLAFGYHFSEKTVAFFARGLSKISAVIAIGVFACWTIGSQKIIQSSVLVAFHPLPIDINIAVQYDRVSAVFSLLTAFFQVVIVRFSRVYLHREPGFSRFFSLLFLLATGMQLLATANNLVIFFIGWELIGLASFFLIAFYREREQTAINALKVMTVYRFGDLGLILSIVFFHVLSKLPIETPLSSLASVQQAWNGVSLLYVVTFGVGIVLAAAAKSAQFPFTFWLPKAMEGPTPSSAIFYGALSVHAGAILLIRLSAVIFQVPSLTILVGALGIITTIFATASSRVQTSIKGQLAYSSAAQVGLIFLQISLGLQTLALYHIVCHSLVRAFQLLLSPSVISRFMLLQSRDYQSPRFSKWSIWSIFSLRVRTSLFVFAMHDSFVEHSLDTLFLRRLRKLHSNGRMWLLAAVSLVASAGLSVLTHQSLTNSFLITASGQAIVLAVFAVCEKNSAKRALDWMGAAILVIAFAVEIAAKGQNFSMAMLTVALIPFWYLVRSQIGSKDAPSSLQGFGGLFSSNPFSAWKMMIGLAAIVGVPPLPGFFFEDYALMVLMKHSPWAVVLAGLAVTINSVAGFRVFAIVTMGSVSKSKIHDASRLPATVGTAMESLPPGAFARMS